MNARLSETATSRDGPSIAPDQLPGMPHPRETETLIGQSEAEDALLRNFAGDRMHHAWLVAGPEGIGKATLAYRFARFALASGMSGGRGAFADLGMDRDHSVFRQVAALSHPNLLVLQRPWQTQTKRYATAITIAEVRRLHGFLTRTVEPGHWRVVIIDRADELNVNAANALLKNLEEPPARTVFLLVSSSPGRLPVTVRSRCRILALRPLSHDDLEKAIAAHASDMEPETGSASRIGKSLPLSQGSVRRALMLLAHDGVELYQRLIDILGGWPRLDYSVVHRVADEVGARGADDKFHMFHDLLEEVIERMMRQAATGTGAVGEEAAIARRLIVPGRLAHWAELWETMTRAKADAMALNLDRKNLVLGAFFRLEEAAGKAPN